MPEKQKEKNFVLLRHGKEIGRFESYNAACVHLQRIYPQSWRYAFHYGGFEVKKVK